MENFLKLIPLVLIVALAIVLVWRGMRIRPDGTANKSVRKPDTHYWGGPGPH